MHSLRRTKTKKKVAEADLEPQMRGDASLDLEASLHQPAEDNSIVANFTSLRGYIESHTLEFYHSEQVYIDVAELKTELEASIPSITAISFEMLARSLIQPESRVAGIRAVIAHMLFASIDFCGASERTILPPRAIAHMSTFNKPHEWTEEMQRAYQHAMSKWRVLSVFLLSAPDGRLPSVTPSTNSWRLAENLFNLFRPFAIHNLKEERVENLKQIVARTAKLGNTLFGHPSTWRFRWTVTLGDHRRQGTAPEDRNTRMTTKPSIMVYPAIEKIGDVDGVELAEPILKEEAEVFFLTTPFNMSSESEVRRQGSLDNNDMRSESELRRGGSLNNNGETSPESTVPRLVAYDRTPPEYSSLPEGQQLKTALAASPTLGGPPFEGQQPRLDSPAARFNIADPQSRVGESNLDVVGPLPPQAEKAKGSMGSKAIDKVQTLLRVRLKPGTKRDIMGTPPFPAQNTSIHSTEKRLPPLPHAQERQGIPTVPERVDNQPSMNTDLYGSENLSRFTNQNIEA